MAGRDAPGPRAVHTDLRHRGVALRTRRRLPRREPLSAGGPRPLHLSHDGLRPHLEEDRHRDPRDAYRVDWSGGFGFPPNEAHPVGKNPPTGAMIYYWLKDKDQRVTLDILDAGGRVVRSFTSKADSITAADSVRADRVKKVRTDSLKQAGVTDSVKIDSIVSDTLKDADKPWPQRPPAPPRVANKAGLNMFVWNMKYPDAAAFWGMVGVGTDGPVALPGV